MRIAGIVWAALLAAGGIDAEGQALDVERHGTVASAPRDSGAWRPFRRWLGRNPQAVGSSARGGPARSTPTNSSPEPAAGGGGTADPRTPPPVAGPATAGAAGATDTSGTTEAAAGISAISSNPGAVNIVTGTGALGRLLGLDEDSGIRLGGLWIGDASGVLSGGLNPGRWGLNGLTVADLNIDTEKAFGLKGGSFGTEFLQFTGSTTNRLAGAFPGFDSLEVTPPLVRQELYQLWYRQSLLDDRLIVRVGKSVPTYDFNNVVRSVPVGDPAGNIPAVTGLLYTPIFVNPTLLGVIPGYYNSATGVTVTAAPTKSLYLNYGFYDGNMANPNPALTQTGLSGPHFNGYYFHIGEAGYSYRLGPERKPGKFGVGVWGQTGTLQSFAAPNATVSGADGVYLFGSQRLWYRRPGVDSSGVSGFYQFGANDSDALLARRYVGGGFTAFGLVPGRPDDTFGIGLASTWLTRGGQAGHLFFPDAPQGGFLPLRANQLMIQAYYQMMVSKGVFLQAALTEIPTPGMNAAIPGAFTLSYRIITLF